MRWATRMETLRGLLVLSLMVGLLQILHLCCIADTPRENNSLSTFVLPTLASRTDTLKVIRKLVYTTSSPALNHAKLPWPEKKNPEQNYSHSIVNHTQSLNTHVNHSTRNMSGRDIALELAGTGDRVPPLLTSPNKFLPPQHEPRVYGKARTNKGFLTIGIPSVRRPTTTEIYLIQTLQSLINQTTVAEKQEVTVVVLLSDFNESYNTALSNVFTTRFQTYLESGFIRMVYPPRGIYPNLEKVKRTYNDGRDRLKWRAKQNIDFAYLLFYSQNISEYYIQLEDDVLCASDFTSIIRATIQEKSQNASRPWFILEFSKLGFIGKLFRSKDISWVATFLLQSFDSHPCDLLLGKMLNIKGQDKPIHSNVSLFQHNGKFSSLKNKLMPSIDSDFKDADKMDLPIMKLPKGDNPQATIQTTFDGVIGYPPSAAYDKNSSNFFWARKVKRNGYFSITLHNPYNLSRIIISTGDRKRKKDSLMYSSLFYAKSRAMSNPPETSKCGEFRKLVDFVDGEIDTKATGITVPTNLLCLKIVAKKDSKTWVIIRDIVLLF